MVLVEEAGVDQLLKEELHIPHLQLTDDDRYSNVFTKFHSFLTSLSILNHHKHLGVLDSNGFENSQVTAVNAEEDLHKCNIIDAITV